MSIFQRNTLKLEGLGQVNGIIRRRECSLERGTISPSKLKNPLGIDPTHAQKPKKQTQLNILQTVAYQPYENPNDH